MAERIFDRRRFLGAAALVGLAAAGSAGMATAAAARPSHADPAPHGDDFGLNARSFGARADGKTDDTAAIQKALDAAGKQGGGVVRLPVGHYLLRGSLRVPECVTLQGVFRALQSGSGSVSTGVVPYSWRGGGSVLLALGGRGRPDGQAFISLHRSSALYGVSIFYPEQHPYRPVEYPWAVRQMAQDICVEDVLLVNPWQGVDCGTVLGQRHYIHGLYGQPLKTGIFIDRCADTGVVENVHFWPFWRGGRAGQFMQRQLTAFLIGRSDGQYMANCSVCPCHIGFHFLNTGPFADGHGSCYGNFIGLDAEGCQDGASLVVEDARFPGLEIYGMLGGPMKVQASNRGPVSLVNCSFWSPHNVQVRGQGAIRFIGCNFTGWSPGQPALWLDGARVTVSNCLFNPGRAGHSAPSIQITPRCISAVVTGNTTVAKDFIVKGTAGLSPRRFQIAGNVSAED